MAPVIYSECIADIDLSTIDVNMRYIIVDYITYLNAQVSTFSSAVPPPRQLTVVLCPRFNSQMLNKIDTDYYH